MRAHERRGSGYCYRFLVVLIAALTLGCCTSSIASAASWSEPTQIYTTSYQWLGYGLSAVSCPTTTFCKAVDSESSAQTYNGSSWSPAESIAGTSTFLNKLSCVSASFCIATAGGNVLTYNGSTWSAPGFVDHSFDGFTSLSCSSASFCAAVDNVGYAVTYSGGSWSTPVYLGASRLSSVSCSSASFCVAGSETGEVITWNGSSWGSPVTIFGPSGYLLGMSCPSASFCAAVTNQGYALTYNGSKWSEAIRIGNYDLHSVSCPSASFCVAVGDGDNAYIYNGNTWSNFAGIDSNGGMKVSCPTTTFCMAVDFKGYALTYTGDPIPVNTQPPTITGSPVQGQTLNEVHGEWLHSPTEYAYQWERCNSGGTSCEAIGGATSPSYVIGATDIGHTIRVTETAGNLTGFGSPVTSSPTAVVQAEPEHKQEKPEEKPTEGSKEEGSGGNKGGGSNNGGKPKPPRKVVKCVVPNVKGKTLSQAKTLLASSHCTVGNVTLDRHHAHRHAIPKVISQKPGAGKTLKKGAPIALTLRK